MVRRHPRPLLPVAFAVHAMQGTLDHMESLSAGTLAGTGSFRCESCGYVLTLSTDGTLPRCPSCDATDFTRASLFPGGRFARDQAAGASPDERAAFLAEARALVTAPGEHMAFREDGKVRVIALTREWTRIGRSLAADIRFDDATVSRRHALVVRQADGVRVLDDRSLNGIFVNGQRVEWRTLRDGDELVVGRHRLLFLVGAAVGSGAS